MTNVEPLHPEIIDRHSAVARMSAPQLQAESVALVEIMESVLIDGSHYGVIPGTKKPTLFKAGAEWLLKWAQYGHRLEAVDVDRDEDGRKYGVTYRCSVFLVGRPDAIVATCDGYCGYDEPDREAHVNRWDKMIPRSPWNTIIKMAEKRALVGAALQACGASGLFTQDLDDYSEAVGRNEPKVDWFVANGWADEATARKANADLIALLKTHDEEVRTDIKAKMAEMDPPIDIAKQWTKAQHDTIESWLPNSQPVVETVDKESLKADRQAEVEAVAQDAAVPPAEVTDIVAFVESLKADAIDDELTRLREHTEGKVDERRQRLKLALLREKVAGVESAN